MRLESIEIKGFKSFRDKTVIEFPSKFTTIVGPNGSGKSNITEAVCFVLGRSRGLRATNLQELIFNGGIDGSPSKKAVVSIKVRGEDGAPHTISRMVDIDGHSMYKLDGKRMTRQHVLDLIGDNEYNIILQDDVTKVIDMRPIERRQIIDELCGIAEYDKKKDKALKELSKVEDRISETHIILGEKQGYLNKLKRERDDALRYKQVQEELDQNRASLLNHDILLYKKRLDRYQEQSGEAEKEKNGLQDQINGFRGQIESKRAELKDINNRIIDLEDGRSKSRFAELKEESARKESLVDTLTSRIAEGAATVSSNLERIEEVSSEEAGAKARVAEIEGEIKALDAEIGKESKAAGDPDLESKVDALKETVFATRSQIDGIDENLERLVERREALVGRRAELEGRKNDAGEKSETGGRELSESEQKLDSSRAQQQQLVKELSGVEQALEKTQQGLEESQIEKTRRKTELSTIEESWGGVHGAEKAVMRLADVIPGIHGAVHQLGEVGDTSYDTALKVAAGRMMHFMVVDNVDVAAKCIDYLKKKEIGRSTFLPLSTVKADVGKKLPSGAIGFARDYINYEKKHAKIFEYVFGDTVIVDDVDSAKKIGVGEYRMVTLDGSLFELSGALTGGHIKSGGEVGFSNLEDLEKKIEEISAVVEELSAERDELVDQKDTVKRSLMKTEDEISELSREVEQSRLASERFLQVAESVGGELARVVEEISAIEAEEGEKKRLRDKMSDKLTSDEKTLHPLAEEKKKHDTSRLDGLKDRRRDLEVESGKLTERAENLRAQSAELEGQIRAHGVSEQTWNNDIEDARRALSEINGELAEVERESATLVGEIRSLINKRGDLEDSIQQLGSRVGELDHEVYGVNERIQKIEVERARADAELETLAREFSKFEGVELVERKVGEMKGLVERLEMKLSEFGAVNLKAVETYDTVKAEYDEIMGKLDTLKSERQSIFDFMEEVEQKKHETFIKTFDVVKENFERIFRDLSDGEGTLILNNPKEISESGLLIKASPGGKKVMSLDAMSGGEKVLTSSAFLLAIQQYKPAFFYIVDELDAALDKTNSVRLAEMLRDSDAQFILVSHNNAMIQFSESVVGVSMAEGVSRIVGVKLED